MHCWLLAWLADSSACLACVRLHASALIFQLRRLPVLRQATDKRALDSLLSGKVESSSSRDQQFRAEEEVAQSAPTDLCVSADAPAKQSLLVEA